MENGFKFCPSCGTKTEASAVCCPNCGNAFANPNGSAFANVNVDKAKEIAGKVSDSMSRAGAEAVDVIQGLTNKEGFASAAKKLGTFQMVLLLMVAGSALLIVTSELMATFSLSMVASVLTLIGGAFYVVCKMNGKSLSWLGALLVFLFADLTAASLPFSYRYLGFSMYLADFAAAVGMVAFFMELKVGPMKKVHVLRFVGMIMGFIGFGLQISFACVTAAFNSGLGVYEIIMSVFSLGAYITWIIFICKLKKKSWIFAVVATSCFVVSAFSLLHIIAYPFWAMFLTFELVARSIVNRAERRAMAQQAQYAAPQPQG